MKSHPLCLLLLGLVLLAGCDSMPDRVRDRFSAVPPKEQVFAGDVPAVYAAAQQAFKRLDFILTHSKQGEIEAVSRIHSSAAFADSRQMIASLHLSEGGPGKTLAELSLTEQVESQSFGGTSKESLRDNGFFATYFATLQQVLQEQAASAPDKKN